MKPLLLSIFAWTLIVNGAHAAERTLKIVVDSSAPAEVRQAAHEILANVKRSAVLRAMVGEGTAPVEVSDSKALAAGPFEERAYSHLVVVGMPDDPMVKQVWQHEAALRDGGLYVFGFGHLLGEIGYIESDRNPFLHASNIKQTPFEAAVVTVTGITPASVRLAAKFFTEKGLVNGVVAGSGWRRGEGALLERSPLQWNSPIPVVPAVAGKWTRLAVTQAAEEEYRGVLADAGIAPEEIWRVKYHQPGVWDGAGAKKAFDHYSAGLHRRAYGNTLWMARFPSEKDASSAAPKIAMAAGLSTSGSGWQGKQPPFGPQRESPGNLALWQKGAWVLMSTLPVEATDLIAAEMERRR